MNFLVDAHLPRRLAQWLRARGHDVIHTRDLPQGNRTGDSTINARSLAEERIVITKDADFEPVQKVVVGCGRMPHDGTEQLN
jgi:predicted nuclease of predicted toxin-antitoxin system